MADTNTSVLPLITQFGSKNYVQLHNLDIKIMSQYQILQLRGLLFLLPRQKCY